jgi:hypothetical protein
MGRSQTQGEEHMSKEAMRLALHKAFQLGQRYWSWSDSEYSSHWKKADAAKAEFDQLVQDTINAALAEQPAQQEPVDSTQISKVWWDGEKLMEKPIPFVEFYKPAQRTWVGLTHEEHMEIMTGTMTTSSRMAAVEAKLKEKNT